MNNHDSKYVENRDGDAMPQEVLSGPVGLQNKYTTMIYYSSGKIKRVIGGKGRGGERKGRGRN